MLTALYIHIPFCNQICTYCDFHKEMATFSKKKAYVDALVKEFTLYDGNYRDIKSVFIGGGTPSSLPIELQKQLFETINKYVDISQVIEFTIETNPNDITEELVDLWKQYGINRVSLGVQTFDDEHLVFLNRSHKKNDIYNAVSILKDAKISNISIDLIFSLINQTIDQVKDDISKFLSLDINHLSYYSLILEEKTKLMYMYNKKMIELNSEDLESNMYSTIIDILSDNGFVQYEISNFTKNNTPSVHNKIYWTNKEYLGLGSGAHSLYNNKRFKNVSSVKGYIDSLNNNLEYQEAYQRDEFIEECIMGLRLLNGIDIERLNTKYNRDIINDIDGLKQMIDNGLLDFNGSMLKFTRKGLMLGNLVFGLFMEEN